MTQAIPLQEPLLIQRAIRWYDYITINIYFLGLTVMSQTNGLIQPLLVQQFVDVQNQGTYYGRLRLASLMVALLFQAIWGLMSDRSTSRWGRRRPYILGGTLGNMVVITLIGFSAGMSGMGGFWFLFTLVILSQVVSNAAQAAQQGLIPDLVSENKRGSFSGIKAMFEVPLPLIIVPFTIGTMIKNGNMWGGILLAVAILGAAMVVTMLVPEKQLKEKPAPFDWAPIIRLGVMTAMFTAVILSMGWAANQVGELVRNIDSQITLLVIMGAAGLVAMFISVAVGVWGSVRISIGESAARNPSFTWWVINRLAFLVGAFNLSTFTVYFIQGRFGYAREAAAGPATIMTAIVGISVLVSAIASGWLADRYGRKTLVMISGLMGFVGVLIGLATTMLPVFYAGGAVIGLATGLFFSANWALGTSLVPKAEAGRYLGISNLAGAGAGAVGAYIGGPIADYFTRLYPGSPGLGYILLFAIYGTLFLLSTLALPFIKEPKAS